MYKLQKIHKKHMPRGVYPRKKRSSKPNIDNITIQKGRNVAEITVDIESAQVKIVLNKLPE